MNAAATRANQLERRRIAFAAAIVSLSSKLPKTPQGRHICGQILRSGTAAAANYGEARGAESRADFIHKLKIVFKDSTKQRSGWRSSGKVPCFHRKTAARLSRKTANCAGLSQPSIKMARASSVWTCSPIGSFGQLAKSITQRTTASGQLTFGALTSAE